jgi:hypothetical protein
MTPRGYARNRLYAERVEDIEWENPAFNSKMVITV